MLQAELIDEFFVVAGAGFGQVTVRRFVALSLRTRVDGDDMVLLRKLIDSLLPDPGRHGPAGDEDDWVAAAGLKIMDVDAVESFERAALRYCCCCRRSCLCQDSLLDDARNERDAQQDCG